MIYKDFKYLPNRTTSDKVLRHKLLLKILSKAQNMININMNLSQLFTALIEILGCCRNRYHFWIPAISKIITQANYCKNKKKYNKMHLSFQDNISHTSLADMQLISKCNKGIRYPLYTADVFSKYTWVFPVKDKKVTRDY